MSIKNALQPIFTILPEVPRPRRPVSLKEKLFWSALVVIVYLIMCEVPLYGIPYGRGGFEELFFFRIILASRKGTLAELGIGPIVTSGIILELLVGSKILELDLSKPEDRSFFTGAQKLLAIIFAAVEALAFILGGSYGYLSPNVAAIVFTQLLFASIAVILMDEMIQKGWGIGSGVNLFIAAGIAQQVFWQVFSPVGPFDGLPLGVVPALSVALLNATSTGNWEILLTVISRRGLPDLIGLISMIAFFVLIIYMENMQVEVGVSLAKYRGLKAKIPFKFLYVSIIPLIFASILYTDIYMFSQIIWSRFNRDNSNEWLNLLAKFEIKDGRIVPLPGCLVYYITPPRGIESLINDPIHVALYALITIGFCMLFGMLWVELTGMDPKSQAEQLVSAGMQIRGFRLSSRIIANLLRKYIPILTVLSSIIVAIISVLGDILGVIGSGIGILLLAGILVQYQGIIAQERALEAYPLLRKLLKS
ncbi:MAG: preprotein translocase subunit SecY [Thermoprotei archaeon]|nr:MAG: preprotein translocase subunit SecY [Thermoprotei archaeon]RLF01083.1 MAG: preprotein translocase subunit SecY [Thermoprotei archaeon]HDI74352.1 preprotein translocase subunit SecY [Thermoprotei archaeon]